VRFSGNNEERLESVMPELAGGGQDGPLTAGLGLGSILGSIGLARIRVWQALFHTYGPAFSRWCSSTTDAAATTAFAQGTRVTSMSYRADGFLGSLVDPLQRSTSFGYDLAGRATATTLPDLSVIGTGYDANGNVTSVTPPGRPAHVFRYTPADSESDYTPPGGASFNTHTSYNLDQQVSNVSRPDGDFIAPTYDPVKGRLTALTTSRGSNTYGYNSTTGQLSSITTFDGVGLTYGYDGSLLKDVTWSGPVSGAVHKTYDSNFRLGSESLTGGQTINFGYDNDDLLVSAGAMTITRDPATGFLTGTTMGAIIESRTYDAFGAEKTYTVTANGTTLYVVDYGTRDALGRIVNRTETIQGATHVYGYIYDTVGRLTDVTTDGNPTSHYEYDANGNRTLGPGLTASPLYDAQDRLLSYGNCTYSYKADGSLQTKTCPNGTTMYDYDAFGNLRAVTLPNGTAITYVIDGKNRRVGKKINGVLVESFLYKDRLRHIGWYDGSGALRAQFVYGVHHRPEYMIKGGVIYRLITDQVGSVRLVVDSAGNIVERIDFDEFGNVLLDTAPGTTRIGFATGMQDPDTGLTRFGVRDYAPEVGRWTAKDPLRFAGGDDNLYSYVHDDPVNRVDPSGRQGEDGFNGGGGGDSGGGGGGRDVGGEDDDGAGLCREDDLICKPPPPPPPPPPPMCEAKSDCNVFECLTACNTSGDAAVDFCYRHIPKKKQYLCSGLQFATRTFCYGICYRFCGPGWK